MKILYASRSPLAGVCELMARCVNEYFGETHEARTLNRGPGRHQWYRREGVDFAHYNIANRNQVDDALAWADVVHCMANTSARDMNRPDLLTRRVWVFQWHGAQIWPFERVWREKDYSKVRWIHIGQGWQRDAFFKPFFDRWGARVIPNIVTMDDPLHKPAPWEDRLDRIAFAPSTSRRKAVNRKGIEETVKGMSGVYQYDLISETPFQECLKRKSVCRLGIDEVVTPLYHRSGLEFLSQGTPCICSYDAFTEQTLKDATGSPTMPFLNAVPDNLRSVISRYFKDFTIDDRQELGKYARRWMEHYYHPRRLLKLYFDVYEKG